MEHGLKTEGFHNITKYKHDNDDPEPDLAERIKAQREHEIDEAAAAEGDDQLTQTVPFRLLAFRRKARREQDDRCIKPQENPAVAERAAEVYIKISTDQAHNEPCRERCDRESTFYIFFLFHFYILPRKKANGQSHAALPVPPHTAWCELCDCKIKPQP
jgi:hypothetical protein